MQTRARCAAGAPQHRSTPLSQEDLELLHPGAGRAAYELYVLWRTGGPRWKGARLAFSALTDTAQLFGLPVEARPHGDTPTARLVAAVADVARWTLSSADREERRQMSWLLTRLLSEAARLSAAREDVA